MKLKDFEISYFSKYDWTGVLIEVNFSEKKANVIWGKDQLVDIDLPKENQ